MASIINNRHAFYTSVDPLKAGVSEEFATQTLSSINALLEKAKMAAGFKPGPENRSAVLVLQDCVKNITAALGTHTKVDSHEHEADSGIQSIANK